MKLLQQLLQWAERTLTAKDYVQYVLIVLLGIAWLNRSDKKEAEKAQKIAEEICRIDRIKTDSAWQARMERRDVYWQAKLDARTQEYINSLRGINDSVNVAVGSINKAIVKRETSHTEVQRKVTRNGRTLDSIKKAQQ
jgi:hypothetical protein